MLQWLSGRKLYCVEKDKLGDYVTLICIFGVLMGGRLGEFFFYWLPEHGLSGFLADPTWVFRVWEGGMAIYGGIIGGVLAGWLYARRKGLPFLRLADLAAPSIALGQAIGRWGNFRRYTIST